MKRTGRAALLALGVLFLSACAGGGASQRVKESADYQKISPEQALALLEEQEGVTLLDVRTPEEFAEARIEGALLLPDYELEQKAEELLPDKDAVLLVYCRSGRRSRSAAQKLTELGYTQVYDFGGIIDWPYKTVSGR